MAEPGARSHPRPKAAENAQRRREQLLRVATRHFSEMPYDDVSMSVIAKEANVSHGLAFHVFGSKQALFEAVLRGAVEDVNRLIVVDQDVPVERRLRGTLDRFFRHVEESEATFRLGLRAGLGPEEELRRIVSEGQEAAVMLILRVFGITRPNRLARVAVRGWTGSLDRAALAWLEEGRRIRRTEIVALLEATLLETLRQCGYADRLPTS